MRKLNLFISSPNDLSPEREIAIKAINKINELPHIQSRFCLSPLAWERSVPSVVGKPPQAIVNRYMAEAAHADIYICFLWQRMGTPVTDPASDEMFQSGTEYEFMQAYRANQKHGIPHILLYRCLRPISPQDADPGQLQRVQEFFQNFERQDSQLCGLINSFQSVNDLEELILRDILALLEREFSHYTPDTDSNRQNNDFFRHIALPPNYISRNHILPELRALILSDAKEIALTSGLLQRSAALHGMGGIGKSVMARALCDDPQVRAAFPHGILWTTLGMTPNLNQCLRDWIQALGGTAGGPAPTINTLAEELSTILEKRACLLIVDDVWEKEHLEPFMASGPYCRLLFTTRNAAIARQIGSQIYPIQAMAKDEAIKLLEAWANGKLNNVTEEIKEEIVEKFDRLPLAIKLAGAQIRQTSPDGWLRDFEKIEDLRTDWMSEDRESSLIACFRLSLDTLRSQTRQLYVSLGIFREDESIPITAISTLWSELERVTFNETKHILLSLADRALLEFRNSVAGDTVTLHDLLLQMINEELGEARISMHKRILNAYAKTQKGNGWHTTADDRYLYDHLAYHLESVQDIDELRKLFADQTWQKVRVQQSGYRYDGYIDDLECFWKMMMSEAYQQIDKGEEEYAIVDCLRSSLIRTSINSIAATYPPEILARGVELGFFSFDRAVSIVSQIPDQGQRLDSVVALLQLNSLDSEARSRLSGIGFDLARRNSPAHYFESLGKVIDKEYLPDVLSSIFDDENRMSVYKALADIIPRLDEELLERTLAFAKTLPEIYHAHTPRHAVLASLAPYLPDHLIEQGLNLTLISHSGDRIKALTAFLPRLNKSHREEIIALAWAEILEMPPSNLGVGHTNCGGPDAMAMIAPFLSDERLKQASEILLRNMQVFDAPLHSKNVIKCFSRYFHFSVFPKVVQLAQNLPEKFYEALEYFPYAESLSALIPRLQELNIKEPVTKVIRWAIENNEELDKLAPVLNTDLAQEAIMYLINNKEEYLPNFTLEFLPYLSTKQKCYLLERCDLSKLAELEGRDISWKAATDDLPDEVFDRVVNAIIESSLDGKWRGGESIHLGSYSPKERKLMELAPRLSVNHLEKYFKTLKTTDGFKLVRATARLLPAMDDEAKAEAVELLLRLFPQIRKPGYTSFLYYDEENIIEIIAPHLSTKRLKVFLELIQDTEDILIRVVELLRLLPYLPETMREQVIELIKSSVWSMEPSDWRYPHALSSIVTILSEEERKIAIAEFFAHLKFGYAGSDRAVIQILPFLSPAELREVARWARQSQVYQIGYGTKTEPLTLLPDILEHLLAHMTSAEIEEIDILLNEAASKSEIVSDYRYYLAKLQLIPYLSPENISEAFTNYVEYIENSENSDFKPTLDEEMVEHLDNSRLSRILEAVILYHTYGRIAALRILIPQLKGTQREMALAILKEDILSLDGIEAVEELDWAIDFFNEEDTNKVVKKELIHRLYIDKSEDRSTILNIIALPNIFSERVLPKHILSQVGKQLIEICDSWSWI